MSQPACWLIKEQQHQFYSYPAESLAIRCKGCNMEPQISLGFTGHHASLATLW